MALRYATLSSALTLASASGPRDYSSYKWDDYIEEFGKAYNGIDEISRYAVWSSNMERIKAHNIEHAAGKQSWWMDVNQFADLTDQEFQASLGRKIGRFPGHMSGLRTMSAKELPSSVDWREKGVVTPVKNQGSCGSCWAFAAIETVESAYAVATGSSPPVLAPQTYVSCMGNPDQCGGTGGCEGAIAELAFNYTIANGVPLESDYPYTASDSACQAFSPAVTVQDFVVLPANDADSLVTALATMGPVAVSVAASQFSLYGGGVFTGCTGQTGAIINHAVQAVGYTDDYWLIRNSWGGSWGEGGYIRLSRAKDSVLVEDVEPGDGFSCVPYPSSIEVAGECGVLSDSTYPTGASAASASMTL